MDEDLHAAAACGKVRACVHTAFDWRMRNALDLWRSRTLVLQGLEETTRLRAECACLASLLATERVTRAHEAFVRGGGDDDLRV